jgi:predicted porin
MRHKLLLGSSALVGAGVLMAGGAEAQDAQVGGIEVVLGGFTEFGIVAGSRNTVTDGEFGGDRKYGFWMDNEIHFEANGATERGVLYGSKIWVEAGTGGLEGDSFDTFVDEASLYFSGNFGRAELGLKEGAENEMYVGAEDAQAGTGGIDGDIPNINFVEFTTTDDAAKVTYFTPRLAGFQLGASFTPDYEEDRPAEDRWQGDDAEGENGVSGGANWVGELGPAALTLSAVLLWAQCESNCTNQTDQGEGFDDDQFSWAVGGLLELAGFTLGAGYNRADDFAPDTQDLDIVNVGLMYSFGDASVSFGYTFNGFSESGVDDSNLFVLSGDLGLLPGVTLMADASYNTEDLGAWKGGADGDFDQDDTFGGVLSIQLDY